MPFSRRSRRRSTVDESLILVACALTLACTYDFDHYLSTGPSIAGGGAIQSGLGGSGATSAPTSAIGGSSAASGGTSSLGGTSNSSSAASTNAGGATSATLPACAGVPYGGLCWYLGAQGLSCQQVCGNHGEVAPSMESFVGTVAQGGTLAECTTLLELLSVTGAPVEGRRIDGLGLGCHVFTTQSSGLWWLAAPAFSVTARGSQAQLVCACTQ